MFMILVKEVVRKMMRKTANPFRFISCMLLVLIMALGSATGAGAATVNKALKLKNASFSKVTEETQMHFATRGAELCASLPKTDKIKKSGMKVSATVYIPKTALKEAGDEISIDVYLYLQGTKAGKNNLKQNTGPEGWNYYKGFVETKYDLTLRLNKNKKLVTVKHEWSKNRKESKAGNYISVKSSGSYYVVNLKNVPVTDFYGLEENSQMDTKTAFILSPSVLFISTTKDDWKGNLYIDNLKLKSASKTQTVKFDTKDYRSLYVSNWKNSAGQKPVLAKPKK